MCVIQGVTVLVELRLLTQKAITALQTFHTTGCFLLGYLNQTEGDTMTSQNGPKLRSQAWWDNSENPDMTALYLERFLNYGLTREELQSGRHHRDCPDRKRSRSLQSASPCPGRAREGRNPRWRRNSIRVSGSSPAGDRQASNCCTGSQPCLSGAGRGALRLSDRRRRADYRM